MFAPLPTRLALLVVALLLAGPAAARDFAVDRQDDVPAASACDPETPNDCSLRGALTVANALDEPSTIVIPAGHYVLSASASCYFRPSADPFAVSTGPSPILCVARNVSLVGAGRDETILDANQPPGITAASQPVAWVNWGTDVQMQGLSLVKGNWTSGTGLFSGGGIFNAGTLTLTDVAVTDNYGGTAGGVSNRGTLTLERCLVARNTSHSGAGLLNTEGGTMLVRDSDVSFNIAANLGGAVFNYWGTVTVVNSALHDNAARNGGAVANSLFHTVTLINTTVSGNRAYDGGGIQNGGDMVIRSSTITGNTARWIEDPGRGHGGGLHGTGTSLVVSNTIFAGNTAASGPPDCNAVLTSEGHNLVANAIGCTATGPGDLLNVDAKLGVLADNGGPTRTHALQPGSPAIDAGDPGAPGSGAPACPATDQRGLLRPVGAGCDIGAVEVTQAFGVERVLPARAGTGGTVLLHVAGNGLRAGATVRLERAGQPSIDGDPIQVDPGGSAVTALVDLAAAASGAWDVVVANPGGASGRLAAALVVEPARTPDVWMQMVGPTAMRPGVPTLFTFVYGNRGNVDALAVPVTLSLAEGMGYRLRFPLGTPPLLDAELDFDWFLQPIELDLGAGPGGTSNLSFLLPVVPAGSTSALQLLLTLPPGGAHGDVVTSFAAVGAPLLTPEPSSATIDAMVAGARADVQRVIGVTVPDAVVPELAQHAREQLAAIVAEGRALLVQTGGVGQQVHVLAWVQRELALRAAKAALEAELAFGPSLLLERLAALLRPRDAMATGPTCPITPCSGGGLVPEGCSCVDIKCDGSGGSANKGCYPPPIPAPPECELTGSMTLSKFLQNLDKCRMTPPQCEALPGHKVVTNDDGSQFCVPTDPPKHCPRIAIPNPVGGGSLDCLGTPIRNSHDPNEKIGVTGVGDEHYLLPGTPLAYGIAFENDPQLATAAAQVVTITDQLDPAKVDLSTFALGPMSFGHRLIPMPPGAQSYTGGVDLRPEQNLVVTIDAGVDLETGLVHWTFTSVDPATMQLTTDADAGFLPPNVNPPEGDGLVTFTVHPRGDLADGTAICNGAEIVFDLNAPIVTPAWCNTFDMTPPESAVAALPATQTATDVALAWSGTDGGSGVATYSVYVSTDGGPFAPFRVDTTDTTATFTGVVGSTYAFYSVAQDGLGNREAAPASGDAQIAIVAGGGGGGGGGGTGTRDLAITALTAPRTVKLGKKPSSTAPVTVRVQNRGASEARIADAAALATLVGLAVESLGTCPAPTVMLRPPAKLRKKPLVLKPKRTTKVRFDVTVACANDAAKGRPDYRLVATLGAFGGADAYVPDDVCPRPVVAPNGTVSRPAGSFKDRGCGARVGRKTFGGPVVLDVVGAR